MSMLSNEGSRNTIALSADGKSFSILCQDEFVNENLLRFFEVVDSRAFTASSIRRDFVWPILSQDIVKTALTIMR